MLTAVLTALLLFVPQWILAYFGLLKFADSNRGWIALFFFGSVILLSTYPLEWGWKSSARSIQHWRFERKIREFIEDASVDQVTGGR